MGHHSHWNNIEFIKTLKIPNKPCECRVLATTRDTPSKQTNHSLTWEILTEIHQHLYGVLNC